MRIQEITNWAYGLTLVFTGLSATAFIASSYSAERERIAVEEHIALDNLADALALGAGQQTDDVRVYIMTGDGRRLASFYDDEQRERELLKTAGAIRSLEPSQKEIDLLDAVLRDVKALDTIERSAIDAYAASDIEKARNIVFGMDHSRVHASLGSHVNGFRQATDTRTSAALHAAKFRSDFFALIARILLGMTAALFIAVLYFVIRRRVAMPLVKMAGVVQKLARQDYDVDVSGDGHKDEIGEMNNALLVFREHGLERERLDAELRKEQRTKDLILQMMHRLQACQTTGEISEMLIRFMPQIFPGLGGGLYILNERHTLLHGRATWGNACRSAAQFDVSDCWALRRGHPHVSSTDGDDMGCKHLEDGDRPTVCVPLSALGETIGLLYIEEVDPELAEGLRDMARLYLELIAENIGLAIANLDLRDRLTDMAIRDPLTGLLNRRSLDNALNHRDEHDETILACIMLDIDHFKRFNDQHGHDAGDMVMRHTAQILKEIVGDTGQVFRFGGEEFTILIRDRTSEHVRTLAETLRLAVSEAPLLHKGRLLGRVTVSLGIASTEAGGPFASLLNRADAALLRAKENGRNRVETAETSVIAPQAGDISSRSPGRA